MRVQEGVCRFGPVSMYCERYQCSLLTGVFPLIQPPGFCMSQKKVMSCLMLLFPTGINIYQSVWLIDGDPVRNQRAQLLVAQCCIFLKGLHCAVVEPTTRSVQWPRQAQIWSSVCGVVENNDSLQVQLLEFSQDTAVIPFRCNNVKEDRTRSLCVQTQRETDIFKLIWIKSMMWIRLLYSYSFELQQIEIIEIGLNLGGLKQ